MYVDTSQRELSIDSGQRKTMLFCFLKAGRTRKAAGPSRHRTFHVVEGTLRSPLVLTDLASETCAQVLKANWKLFPGTTPHSMPFDSWIIFLKFWSNLLFSPLLCIFGAELFPVFPHSCLSEGRNHKNAAKQSLSTAPQFHLSRLKRPPASRELRTVSGIFNVQPSCLLTQPASPPADLPATQAITGHLRIRVTIRESTRRKHTDNLSTRSRLPDFPTYLWASPTCEAESVSECLC